VRLSARLNPNAMPFYPAETRTEAMCINNLLDEPLLLLCCYILPIYIRYTSHLHIEQCLTCKVVFAMISPVPDATSFSNLVLWLTNDSAHENCHHMIHTPYTSHSCRIMN
jgi:hypothetical protein